MRERKGVLTTTISHYGDRIETLTGQVAALRTEESAVRVRLDAKQAELDHALDELGVARKHLAVVKARLHRALVTLRERLVAIYEAGSPDVLNVVLSAGDYDELVNRAEYLDRINGMDEAVVGRVRELRNQVKQHLPPPALGQGPDRSRARLDRRRRAGAADARQRRPAAPGDPGRDPRRTGRGAEEDRRNRRGARRRRRRDPGQDRRAARRLRLGAARRRADPAPATAAA